MVEKIFKKLQNEKQSYLNSKKGKDFEDRIENLISDFFTKIVKDDFKEILMLLKNQILSYKTTEKFIKNDVTEKNNHFVIEPYGSQSYPDIIIFYKNKIIAIEIKFTEKKKRNPFWNSGIPRLNGIYIFGSYGFKDITFFRGKDIIDEEELLKIEKFNNDTNDYFNKFNENVLSKQKYGFHYYNRKAYQQGIKYNRKAITDFFTNLERNKLEKNVIESLKNL